MENKERLFLTTEEALSLLPEDEEVHTFRSIRNVLIGADWDRNELQEEIGRCRCELGGPLCRSMGHGLVIWTGDDPLFVKTKGDSSDTFAMLEKKLEEIKKNIGIE